MTSPVEFDIAHDAQGNIVLISEAQSGAHGYFCIGCSSEMVAYKGSIYRPHFKHHAKNKADERLCPYSNETVRHKLAKEILLRLKRIKVPDVLALRPLGYTGTVPRLAKAAFIEADTVLAERHVYEDETGRVRMARKFDDGGGSRHLLLRPDIIFLDAQSKPMLFIEICVTHAVDDAKLAVLRGLNVNTIEVRIPPTHHPAEIESLFSTVAQTRWLHHQLQTLHPFNPDDTGPTSPRGRKSAVDEGQLSEFREAVKCRTFRVKAALRGIGKCLESPDFAQAESVIGQEEREVGVREAAIRAEFKNARKPIDDEIRRIEDLFVEEQARLEGEIARVNIELGAAYRATDEELQRRVEARRAEYRGTQAVNGAEREAMEEPYRQREAAIKRRFREATDQLQAEERAWDAEFETASDELRGQEASLGKLIGGPDGLREAERRLEDARKELDFAEEFARRFLEKSGGSA
jgi:hypothetical protein